jgi:hypothetical protein
VTPDRRYAHDADTESIKVYSPPSAVQQPYPAHIAPLRGMATQRQPYIPPTSNDMGSPFQTPPSHNTSANPNRMSANLRNERGVSVFSSVSEMSADNNKGVLLTPARYDDAPFDPSKRTDISRPTTTFTEMLHEAGFPDPMNEKESTPAVPKIPDGYSRGRR